MRTPPDFILEHLGLWAPLPTERSPPLAPASWPRHANLPLTYHPTSPELPHFCFLCELCALCGLFLIFIGVPLRGY